MKTCWCRCRLLLKESVRYVTEEVGRDRKDSGMRWCQAVMDWSGGRAATGVSAASAGE